MGLSACCKVVPHIDSYEVSILGMSGFYRDETDELGFTIRDYYLNDATIVAESFGYSIDDYYLDIDYNGIPEILCNCVYGGDGHRELYVYKIQDDMIMQGMVDYEKIELPGFDYWGANALQTEYDPGTGSIRVYYSTDFHEELKVTYTDFDALHFILWDPTPAPSIYTGGKA